MSHQKHESSSLQNYLKTMNNKVFVCPKNVFLTFFMLVIISCLFVNAAFSKSFSDDEREIFRFVNLERHRNYLIDLDWDERLARMARDYSQKMANENFFEHADINGKTVVDRAKEWRIKNWRKIGETLFLCEGYESFDALAVRGWMQSPTHQRNILDKSWTTTGIGIARSRTGKIYITQIFLEE